MRSRGARRAPHPLFQDEDIDIDDARSGPGEAIEDDEDNLAPLDDDEFPSDEDDLEEEEAAGSHQS